MQAKLKNIVTGMLIAAGLGAGVTVACGQTLDTVIASGQLAEPYGVAVDNLNNYYVTASVNNRIVKFVPRTGLISNFAGDPRGEFGSSDGTGEFARFSSPQGIVVARGALIVADSENNLIRRVGFDGVVTTLAGQANSLGALLDGAGREARFSYPTGLAADKDGNIIIADEGNNAVRILKTNNVVETLATGLLGPSAVAVGDDGRIFVAERARHSIKAIETDRRVTLLAGSGSQFISGREDATIATEATFQSPRGLLWLGAQTGLLVSDTGNNRLRRVYFNTTFDVYSVDTVAASLNAVPALQAPFGLAKDEDGNILVVDLDAGTLRRIKSTDTPHPPVARPIVGVVNLVTNVFADVVTQLTPVTNAVFNNEAVIAIISEPGTQTFFTMGATTNQLSLPDPDPQNGTQAPAYSDGSTILPQSLRDPLLDDMIIKAIGTAPDRISSPIVTARFQFKVANPVLVGNNPAAITMETLTEKAELWYTIEPSLIPTRGGTGSRLYESGTRLSVVNGTNDVTLNVRGFRDGYVPSGLVQRKFFYTNLVYSTVGVARDFFAGIGSTAIIPIDAKLIPDEVLKSLQFRVEVAPVGPAPVLTDAIRVLPFSENDFVRATAPGVSKPDAVIEYATDSNRGVAIAYLANDNSAFRVSGAAKVAVLGIRIPPTAEVGSRYQISVLRPSGTSDGIQAPVALTNLAARSIIVTNIAYTVGDTAIASWYNAGDFGNGDLNNNDVNNVFFASLGVRQPFRFSDAFDAMDAFPPDSVASAGGDGLIRFLDWQVVFKRALGLDTNNWRRSRSALGQRVTVSTGLSGAPNLPAQQTTLTPGRAWDRQVRLSAQSRGNQTPGGTVEIPISVVIAPNQMLSGMFFRAVISPLGNAPALPEPASFILAPGIPPAIESQFGANDFARSWNLGDFNPSLRGTATLGSLQFRIPLSARDGDTYLVWFFKADGSPNSTTQLDFETLPGKIVVGGEVTGMSSAITAEWRQHFFGAEPGADSDAATALNALLAADANPAGADDADPDADGLSNAAEYAAGTDPGELRLHKPSFENAGVERRLVIRWFGAPGRRYVVESSSSLNSSGPSESWTTVESDIPGDGTVLRLDLAPSVSTPQFYRVKILQ